MKVTTSPLAVVLLCSCTAIIGASQPKDYLRDEEFQLWVSQHYDGRSDLDDIYPTWRKNADFVKHQNSLHLSYSLSVNKFAHLANMNGYLTTPTPAVSTETDKKIKSNTEPCVESPGLTGALDSVDWREKGVVPPVTNQGQTGSAIVFGVVDSIDSFWAIQKNHNKLVRASYDEYRDCCTTNNTCTFLSPACYTCVTSLGGLASQTDYHSPNHTCRSASFKPVATVNDGAQVQPTGDEKALVEQVAKQPVAVAVDASLKSFQMYSSGVYYDAECSTSKLNHVMLVVGYGSRDGKDFWIVKNSWGEDWGMKGYILMARNEKNNCGIATNALYPVLFCDSKEE